MILPFQFNINLVEVKGPEKPQDLPKKKKTWSLRELRSVDGKWSQQIQSDFRFTHTKVIICSYSLTFKNSLSQKFLSRSIDQDIIS